MNLLHYLGQVTPICFGLERVRPVLYQFRDLSRLNREERYWLRRLSSVRKTDLGDDFIAVRDQPVDSEAPVACCRVLVVHFGKVVSSADSLLRLWPFHDELIAQDAFDRVKSLEAISRQNSRTIASGVFFMAERLGGGF